MAPEYEVDIPSESCLRFEKYVSKIGGKILKKPLLSPEEVFSEWTRQVVKARELINLFENSEDSAGENLKIQRLQRMVKSRVISDGEKQIRPDVDWFWLKQTLAAFLKEKTPETIPEKNVWTQYPPPHRKLVFAGWTTLPRDVIFLIEKYGLTGGEPKKVQQMTEKYDLSKSQISVRIAMVLGEFFAQEEVQQGVFTS